MPPSSRGRRSEVGITHHCLTWKIPSGGPTCFANKKYKNHPFTMFGLFLKLAAWQHWRVFTVGVKTWPSFFTASKVPSSSVFDGSLARNIGLAIARATLSSLRACRIRLVVARCEFWEPSQHSGPVRALWAGQGALVAALRKFWDRARNLLVTCCSAVLIFIIKEILSRDGSKSPVV